MTFTFVIGQDLTMLFQVAGADPSPQPSPVSIYPTFAPIYDNALTGTVATYEEVQQNGN